MILPTASLLSLRTSQAMSQNSPQGEDIEPISAQIIPQSSTAPQPSAPIDYWNLLQTHVHPSSLKFTDVPDQNGGRAVHTGTVMREYLEMSALSWPLLIIVYS